MLSPSCHPDFSQKWQELMVQMERILTLSYDSKPDKYALDLAVDQAKDQLDGIVKLGDASPA